MILKVLHSFKVSNESYGWWERSQYDVDQVLCGNKPKSKIPQVAFTCGFSFFFFQIPVFTLTLLADLENSFPVWILCEIVAIDRERLEGELSGEVSENVCLLSRFFFNSLIFLFFI